MIYLFIYYDQHRLADIYNKFLIQFLTLKNISIHFTFKKFQYARKVPTLSQSIPLEDAIHFPILIHIYRISHAFGTTVTVINLH